MEVKVLAGFEDPPRCIVTSKMRKIKPKTSSKTPVMILPIQFMLWWSLLKSLVSLSCYKGVHRTSELVHLSLDLLDTFLLVLDLSWERLLLVLGPCSVYYRIDGLDYQMLGPSSL